MGNEPLTPAGASASDRSFQAPATSDLGSEKISFKRDRKNFSPTSHRVSRFDIRYCFQLIGA